jgi:hypothetical protein
MYPIGKFNTNLGGTFLCQRICGVCTSFFNGLKVFCNTFFCPKCSATQKRLGNTGIDKEREKERKR